MLLYEKKINMVSKLVEENPWRSPQGDTYMEENRGWQRLKIILGYEEIPRQLVDKGLRKTLVYGKVLRFCV